MAIMRCPECNNFTTCYSETRSHYTYYREYQDDDNTKRIQEFKRTRFCKVCYHRFTTVEIHQKVVSDLVHQLIELQAQLKTKTEQYTTLKDAVNKHLDEADISLIALTNTLPLDENQTNKETP